MATKPYHIEGAVPYTYWTVERDIIERTEGGVIEESLLSLFVNGQELATMMCSPIDQEALAIGFLYNEAVIDSMDDIRLLQPNAARTAIDIFLKTQDFNPPRRMILTSGCGGGITLNDLSQTYPSLDSHLATTPEILLARMKELQGEAHLYNAVRGVHTAILANENVVLASAEDVGRHNTVDKVAGKALQQGISTTDKILMTSGRISSEMIAKARRMAIPIVASRTAPTSISVDLAQVWNICVVGYMRQGGFRVYTHPERLGITDA